MTIARDAIQREMQHHAASKPFTAWQNAARALAVRELLLQEARHIAIVAEPLSDDEGRRETDEEAIIRGLIEHEVRVPEPDDETCRRYYAHNGARFRSADIYEASHILFAALPSDREAFAQARADAEACWRRSPISPSRSQRWRRLTQAVRRPHQGGNLGQIIEGQTTPEFEAALIALAPGQFCEAPVETRYGFHIIRLDRKIEGRTLPYEVVAGRIADYLRDSVRRRADAQYIARLVSAAHIEGIDIAGADALRVH